VHDFHVPISPSGLYWTLPIPGKSLNVDSRGTSAVLEVVDLAVIDEPKFPKPSPTYPAVESFRIVWEASGGLQTFEDAAKHYRVIGYPAVARAEFAVAVPELNFAWRSEPLETSTSMSALLGKEVNGYYYDQGTEPGGVAIPSAELPSRHRGR